MGMIDVRGVGHSFEGRSVLQDISFSAAPGEIIVIMGSSGGGKTTLLKCISGLLTPEGGEVIVDGVSARTNPEAAHRKMGLVFQYAALFDFLNVEQNILFGVERHLRLTREAKRALVRRLLDQLGLGAIESQMPAELSGGMRKRVGLARALALEPKILLYDEPTSGLDPITAYSIDRLIVETRDRTGCTSLVVSHDVTGVLRVADRILFLHQGRMAFLGTPDEFRHAGEPIRELVEKSRAESLQEKLEKT